VYYLQARIVASELVLQMGFAYWQAFGKDYIQAECTHDYEHGKPLLKGYGEVG